MEKDYSLLRPFYLEAAKRGDKLCWASGDEYAGRYLAGPDRSGDVAFEDREGDLYVRDASEFRMAPLCWVDGRPVYKGDVLYGASSGLPYIAESHGVVPKDPGLFTLDKCAADEGAITLTPPKVKREGWVNVYPGGDALATLSDVWPTKEVCDELQCYVRGRLACIRIEWEE